ncbi:MAG: sugar ABC transporter ATP-binding protein [Anaerococcus sp.]
MSDKLLELKNVGKSYVSNTVLSDVSFSLDKGKILGLVGENGAGKSTLMNIIFGMEVISSSGGFTGEIEFDGKKINFSNPSDALKAGIGMVHQEFSLIPGFSVAENITLNMEKIKPSFISKILGEKLGTIDKEKNINDSKETLDKLGIDLDVNEYVSEMPVGHKQFIEIAREIRREDVKMIILDEPTAVLTETEADTLIDSIKRLSNLGISIIFISHRLREILEACDEVIVLRDGKIVEKRQASSLEINEVASLMVGKMNVEALALEDNRNIEDDDYILQAKGLWVDMPGEGLYDATFDVKRGEILGIAGLAGQGKLGIPNGILGTFPVGGQVIFNGEELKLGDTSHILDKKIAFVSEDRRGVGLLLKDKIYLNIAFNAMQVQNKFTKNIFGMKIIDEEKMIENAQDYIDSLSIRCMSPNQAVGELSGGNQQKVCLAKAMTMDPELLFVSEPTRGIDIGAKKLVLNSLKDTNRKNNTSIVMISSELEELISICDRIAVVCDGKIAGVLPPNAPAEQFALLMSGEKVV